MNDERDSELLQGRVAIVTGASSGIGEATARRLAAAGAAVVLVARRFERLDRLQTELENAGARALAIPTDVTDREAVEVMAATARDWFERIDILVNNAGVMLLAPMRQVRWEEWDRMLDVNVRGLLYCTGAVLPIMLEQRAGHVVNVGSVAGRRAFADGAVYSGTKFAVRALSAGMRLELSPSDGIRVTDIQPGAVATELIEHVTDPDTRQRFDRRWVEKRKLEPDDVARAIQFAVTQPPHVSVNEVLVRPTDQEA